MAKSTDQEKKEDYRTFLSLKEEGQVLEDYANTDPRFKDRSECARHLLKLGMKHDKKARDKAFKKVGVV